MNTLLNSNLNISKMAATIADRATRLLGVSTPDPYFRVRKRPDPTRYGDWERNGRCTDFS